jgi:hypothetical protein
VSHSSITEYDAWPRVRRAIEDELEGSLDDLRRVPQDALIKLQTKIEVLEWVLDRAKPKPQSEE